MLLCNIVKYMYVYVRTAVASVLLNLVVKYRYLHICIHVTRYSNPSCR